MASVGVRIASVSDLADTRPPAMPAVIVTNYQRLKHFDPECFAGVVLDESQILKNFTGGHQTRLCSAFAATPYRLCCTATPAPNDYLELGNHADFLGVMPANEMLMRWFINNPEAAGDYRLKGHAEADYWKWLASWACTLTHPRDLGFDEPGYDLPPLEFESVVVDADVAKGPTQASFSGPANSPRRPCTARCV